MNQDVGDVSIIGKHDSAGGVAYGSVANHLKSSNANE